MEEIAAYELQRMKDMDAYIDIRATTNISMWHNVSDEAQRRYRQYYWGPIHLSGALQPHQVVRAALSQRRHGPAGRRLPPRSTRTSISNACLVDYEKMGRAMEHLEA